jgi:hypothetical protein
MGMPKMRAGTWLLPGDTGLRTGGDHPEKQGKKSEIPWAGKFSEGIS